MRYTSTAKAGYSKLFAEMVVNPDKTKTAEHIADTLFSNKDRYVRVSQETGVPWFFIGICHHLEANGKFDRYLGNGQLLSEVTTLVPRGRGPFSSFESGAVDALRYQKLDKEKDWSLPHMLYLIESFNGFGYTKFNVNSPYLWSFSNLYSKGKFVADGEYDASAVSEQCGAAVILKAMIDKGYVTFEDKTQSQGGNMNPLAIIGAIASAIVPTLTNTTTPLTSAGTTVSSVTTITNMVGVFIGAWLIKSGYDNASATAIGGGIAGFLSALFNQISHQAGTNVNTILARNETSQAAPSV